MRRAADRPAHTRRRGPIRSGRQTKANCHAARAHAGPGPDACPAFDPATVAPSFARGTLTKRPYAVMIDNHPDAYPQTGLDHALVVFEALAEFGITRFMAIYAPGIGPDAPAIGPVRSARLYYVQWAMGFGTLYAHAGGSPQGSGAGAKHRQDR